MSIKRHQELLQNLRHHISVTRKNRGWSMSDMARRFKIDRSELDGFFKPSAGKIEVKRQTLSKLLREAYRRHDIWDPMIIRLLIMCRDYQKKYQ